MFHATRCSACGRGSSFAASQTPKSSNHYPTLGASCGVVCRRCSGGWRCPVLSVVLVKGVRGNLGTAWTALVRTLISGCEIPQLAGVHGARTIAPPTASLSICPRLASSWSSSLPHRATSASSSSTRLQPSRICVLAAASRPLLPSLSIGSAR